ncbi:YicC/YloC family endoribonuclease [Guptibacillus hwajinpoensis]|uniref:YicC/YloC family endoribonuclease n=1 Tax=Guptibacillus hwajinpoensis TaxID=208199 RepID=UPI001CFCEC00|nr:YicC/YloC family endoribonuclease [Pseudalkalibacillus hwajinpoensis]WLR59701.1 YicC/YloC family endoribonuclease [Pseudalkalibacillus hwajinpoensis]
MVKSMTGFGRASNVYEGVQVTIEMKSVNHRYFDGTFRMPKAVFHLEGKMKKAIQSYVNRGKIELYLTIDGADLKSSDVQVDWHLLDQYITILKQATERYHLKEDLSASTMMNLNVFQVNEKEHNIEQLEESIFYTLNQAIHKLVEMRQIEGKALDQDIRQKLANMNDQISSISRLSHEVTTAFENRIRTKLESFKELDEVDEARILSEVAFLADKASIDEEIIRLRSHLDQFHDILSNDGVVGRKLDFLVQEINRELNTIGSKSQHHKISQHIVDLKSEVEKVREQVQNIE